MVNNMWQPKRSTKFARGKHGFQGSSSKGWRATMISYIPFTLFDSEMQFRT